MHYHIDKSAAQSAYLQLYHQLRRDIVSGVYPLGTKMPSKRLIATETGVSVITVEHALAILCDEGYLESRERSGFFVSFAAADCFPVSETETERRTTVSHGTEDEFPFPSLAKTMRRVLSEYGESILVKSPNNGCAALAVTRLGKLWKGVTCSTVALARVSSSERMPSLPRRSISHVTPCA